MKLSEAIRLGAMNRRQAFKAYFCRSENTTCAIGAAIDAMGRLGNEWTCLSAVAEDLFPILVGHYVDCPVTGNTRSVFLLITELNDIHRWTREQIADWVESIEGDYEIQKEQPSVQTRPIRTVIGVGAGPSGASAAATAN